MNVIDDLLPPEFHYVTFAEWEEFKREENGKIGEL